MFSLVNKDFFMSHIIGHVSGS